MTGRIADAGVLGDGTWGGPMPSWCGPVTLPGHDLVRAIVGPGGWQIEAWAPPGALSPEEIKLVLVVRDLCGVGVAVEGEGGLSGTAVALRSWMLTSMGRLFAFAPQPAGTREAAWRRLQITHAAVLDLPGWLGRDTEFGDACAVSWASAGCVRAEQVEAFGTAVGATGAAAWFDRGWDPDEAGPWARAGFGPTTGAGALVKAGLSPDDAADWKPLVDGKHGWLTWKLALRMHQAGWDVEHARQLGDRRWLVGLTDRVARQLSVARGLPERRLLLWQAGFGPGEMAQPDVQALTDEDLHALIALRAAQP